MLIPTSAQDKKGDANQCILSWNRTTLKTKNSESIGLGVLTSPWGPGRQRARPSLPTTQWFPAGHPTPSQRWTKYKCDSLRYVTTQKSSLHLHLQIRLKRACFAKIRGKCSLWDGGKRKDKKREEDKRTKNSTEEMGCTQQAIRMEAQDKAQVRPSP